MLPGGGYVEGDGGQLGGDGYQDHGWDADVVEDSEQPAAEKPEDTEGAFKDAIAGGPAVLGDHAGHGCFEDGFLQILSSSILCLQE